MVSTLERRRMHKGLQRSKCCSHFFNTLLLIAALGVIGVSVWIFLSVWMQPWREGALYVVGIQYLVCNIIPAAVGVVMILVVLVGMCGLCTTHRCTLLWYFSLLMVTFVLTIAACVFNFIFYFQLSDTITSGLSKTIRADYGLYGFEEATRNVDLVQTQFTCCGSTSYEEWRTSEWHRYEELSHFNELDVPTLPPSCCVMAEFGNDTAPLNVKKCSQVNSTYPNEYMHSEGCSELLYNWLALHTLILAASCAVLFVAELMSIISCAVLFRCLGPVHYEEKILIRRMKGDPDWDRQRRRKATSRV